MKELVKYISISFGLTGEALNVCSVGGWLRAVAEGTRLFNISSLNYLIYGWLITAYLGGSISCGAQ